MSYAYSTGIKCFPTGEVFITDTNFPCSPEDFKISIEKNDRVLGEVMIPVSGLSKLIKTLKKFERYTKEVVHHEKG